MPAIMRHGGRIYLMPRPRRARPNRESVTDMMVAAIEDNEDTPDPRHKEAMARAIVDAREYLFTGPDGTPDFRGRSGPYREWLNFCYEKAQLSPGRQAQVQGAVRIYVSREIHRRLDAAELVRYGMDPRSVDERQAEREERRRLRKEVLEESGPISSPEELEIALQVMEGLGRRIQAGQVAADDARATRRRISAIAHRIAF